MISRLYTTTENGPAQAYQVLLRGVHAAGALFYDGVTIFHRQITGMWRGTYHFAGSLYKLGGPVDKRVIIIGMFPRMFAIEVRQEIQEVEVSEEIK